MKKNNKFVLLWLTCLSMIVVSAVLINTAVPHKANAAEPAKAEWYLYGHKVIPEEPQLELLNGKEVVMVNGVQVFPTLSGAPRGPIPKLPAPSAEQQARHQLSMKVAKLKDDLLAQGLSQAEIMSELLGKFASSELVESAEVLDAVTIKLRWQGETSWIYKMFLFQRQNPEDVYKQRVETEYQFLHTAWDLSCLMIISSNVSYLFNPLNPDVSLDQVRAEIRSIQSNSSQAFVDGTWHGQFIKKARVANELRNPRPKVFLREG